MLYGFIYTQLSDYKISEKCRVLQVCKQGYYKWKRNLNKPYKHADLLVQIKAVLDEHPENRENYGANRVFLRLCQSPYNYTGCYSTVYRVMKSNNLLHKIKKNPNSLTKEDVEAQKIENLIKQDFSADTPNIKWLTDISKVPTADGKLYISPVLDCFDGQIVGLFMDDNMRKELCVESFEQACKKHDAKGMILPDVCGPLKCNTCSKKGISI